jgi:hypothetical protein
LTRWGWQLSSNTCVELARNWGYTLDLGQADDRLLARLQNPNSMESGFVALAKKDPATYALSVLINRSFPTPIPDGFWCTNSEGLFVDASTNAWSSATNNVFKKVVSPEGPDEYWQAAAEYAVAPLRAIQLQAPIAIALNGGEYGLDVAGFGRAAWLKDPRVRGATNGLSIPRYSSNRKAHQLDHLTAAVRQALLDRELYIFYNTGNEQNRYTALPDWFNTYAKWGWNSDVMVRNTDLPSFENYYTGAWTTITNPFPNDILSRHLNAVGYNIKLGHPLNYSWVCGGWGTNTARLSDVPRYMGFLKCLYTAGMVGAVAGYFDYPPGGFSAPFPAYDPPHWLRQILALAHAHALFTRLDEFLLNGDLLPSSFCHMMAADQPSYEFPTDDPATRVVARKLKLSNEWLITAWASEGSDRVVTANVTDLGELQILARISGSVYRVTGASTTLLDIDGTLPTATLAAPGDIRILNPLPE